MAVAVSVVDDVAVKRRMALAEGLRRSLDQYLWVDVSSPARAARSREILVAALSLGESHGVVPVVVIP